MLRPSAAVGFILLAASPAAAVELVKGGQPVAAIVVNGPLETPKAKAKAKAPAAGGDVAAARLLADWLQKMSGAAVPVQTQLPVRGPVVFVGEAAVQAGLKLDDIDSPTKEGVRIVVEENRVLIAGQSPAATMKAVCRFLEHLGCRYFMDTPLGEVYPRGPDVAVAPVTITEKPRLLYRNPKGPTWMGGYWKAWNGAGGEDFAHAHSWGRYIPKGLFADHPEYFAMGADGKRKDGDWLCTSNPGARDVFARGVAAVIAGGVKNPSISPPDGRGYCQCPACKAQDDPKVIEPSSGTVAVSTRYADFFDDVARRVGKDHPGSTLSFYVYADYTQPPTRTEKLAPNLCAVIAPIRYCRLHALGDPACPSRKQQVEMIDGWAKVAPKLGYYNYMYNLADATFPMFKFTPCKVEFPALADRGLAFMTIEVLSNWYLYGPQIYLSLRMAYDPRLDPAAVMDDYYAKFYGPAAAPMKAYWQGVDEASQLGAVGEVLGGERVVEEGDRAAMALVHQGPQHRQHRGDPAAARDEQQVAVALAGLGEHEVAPGFREAQHQPGCGVVDQVAADPTGRVGLDRELEGAVGPVGRAGQAEAAPVDHAVDRHPHQHVLAGPEALPGRVGPEGERDGAGGLALHGDDLGPHLADDPAGVDQLEVAIDAVGSGQAIDQIGGQGPTQEAGGAGRAGGGKERHGGFLGLGDFGEQLFTSCTDLAAVPQATFVTA
mgnify:CR=1 FL=1